MADREIDEATGVETVGHEWDGIKELDNPMPRWWLWTFYATIIFSIGYMIYYPSIPLIEDSTQGISGHTNRAALQVEMAEAAESRQVYLSQIADSDLQVIRGNEELARFAVAGGDSAFKIHCSQCHGTGAQGSPGYPNLNDDDWLWGGDLDAIYLSIKHGIRNDEDDDARYSEMPAYGADELLERDEIAQVTQYVLQISGQDHDRELAALGEETFGSECATCHGPNGGGDREFGAPNLTDAISLYGNNAELIARQIRKPKHGVMPAWGDRLSDETVKQLAIYVHNLGGGE
ncbi:MAG: cytochrome-c oxidase, cbb3-type subunit III [Roseovarius sp.]|nr:cytochrome-c oxidase, cbb3-type subunit III [Roseovarius sp.]